MENQRIRVNADNNKKYYTGGMSNLNDPFGESVRNNMDGKVYKNIEEAAATITQGEVELFSE